MGMFEIIDLMSSKDGYELFKKAEEILNSLEISVYDESGVIKNFYTVCCDVAEVMNKGK